MALAGVKNALMFMKLVSGSLFPEFTDDVVEKMRKQVRTMAFNF